MVQTAKMKKTFIASVFFVLGFALIFSIVGVLLQTVLANVSLQAQAWLGRVGGTIIILFGLYLVGLLDIPLLKREYKLFKGRSFSSVYLTSFVFGAAFAVGWTPCVSAALGAILALAVTQASSAFVLLLSYTLGLGVPFMVVGLFVERAQAFFERFGRIIVYFQYLFGALLIIIGILVFTSQLSRIANLQFVTNVLLTLNIGSSAGSGIASANVINMGIAFFAGLASFLSPCVLPIIPGFLSYLASVKK